VGDGRTQRLLAERLCPPRRWALRHLATGARVRRGTAFLSASDEPRSLAKTSSGQAYLEGKVNGFFRFAPVRTVQGYSQNHTIRGNRIERPGFCGMYFQGIYPGDTWPISNGYGRAPNGTITHQGPIRSAAEADVNKWHVISDNLIYDYGRRVGHGSVRQTASFFEFSLCLSRACLGTMIVFIYKWLKNAGFCSVCDFHGATNTQKLRILRCHFLIEKPR
jgi:hypothetical protein